MMSTPQHKGMEESIRHKIITKLGSDYVMEIRTVNEGYLNYYIDIRFCNERQQGSIQLRSGGSVHMDIKKHGEKEERTYLGVHRSHLENKLEVYKAFHALL